MKIEITVEGQEPIVHKLTKDKTLLGSGSDCDIPVDADGISRKHLMIVAENDQYFAVDQGSTNGSFINEERMVPGQRTGFTSFFPIKMGFYVTVALLSDDEGGGESFDFAKSLSKSSEAPKPSKAKAQAPTQTGIQAPKGGGAGGAKLSLQTNDKAKKERGPRSKKEAESEEKGSQGIKMFAIFIAIFGTAGLWYLTKSGEDTESQAPVVQVTAPSQPVVNLAEVEFKQTEISGLETVPQTYTDQKCILDEAKVFCQELGMPLDGYPISGVSFTPTSILIVLPYVAPEAVFDTFQPTYGFKEKARTGLQQITDLRDLASLYLGKLSLDAWEKVNEERRWVYIVFIGASTQSMKPAFVADGLALKKFASTLDLPMLKSQAQDQGLLPVEGFGGFFRAVPEL